MDPNLVKMGPAGSVTPANTTLIGRKNATELYIYKTLTSSLGNLKSSFYHIHKLFTIVNRLGIKLDLGCNKLLERILQIVIRLILSAITVCFSLNVNKPYLYLIFTSSLFSQSSCSA